MTHAIGGGWRARRWAGLLLVTALVAGCEEGASTGFFAPKADKGSETEVTTSDGKSTKLIERDVEAPDVFQVTEAGLWDGRPSLGGVWVAHADVTDPQRVIIRNTANNKFVIGALFRREREIPGPRIQASSDAAAALGMVAGAPVQLNVTALQRETISEEPEVPAEATVEKIEAQPGVETAKLDPIAGAAAAIEAAPPIIRPSGPSTPGVINPLDGASATEATISKPKSKAKSSSSLKKPYIQIGIFSVEANSNRAANQMRSAGMVPTIFKETTNGKPFWRVVVGPAQTSSEASALLKKVKATGFSDAYFVSK